MRYGPCCYYTMLKNWVQWSQYSCKNECFFIPSKLLKLNDRWRYVCLNCLLNSRYVRSSYWLYRAACCNLYDGYEYYLLKELFQSLTFMFWISQRRTNAFHDDLFKQITPALCLNLPEIVPSRACCGLSIKLKEQSRLSLVLCKQASCKAWIYERTSLRDSQASPVRVLFLKCWTVRT